VAKRILIEELHLIVRAPHGLRQSEYDAFRQALDDPRLHRELRQAVRGVVRQQPALARVSVTVTW
jgi:hypothetical protein